MSAQGTYEAIACPPYTLTVYLPPQAQELGPLPVLYSCAGESFQEEMEAMLRTLGPAIQAGKCRPFIGVSFHPLRWFHDFSPWPAPPLSRQGEPFGNGAPVLLECLIEKVMPLIAGRYPASPDPRDAMLLGYSLSGLFSLWALYQTDAFGACGCCSGSLWYEGWIEYMQAHRPAPGSRIYLSLGRKEEKARGRRTALVGDATRQAIAMLEGDSNVDACTLAWHDGGHSHQVIDRMTAAILWLMRPC